MACWGMAARVRVEQIGDGYDVVLADDDALVLAHYDAGDCGDCDRPQDRRLHAPEHRIAQEQRAVPRGHERHGCRQHGRDPGHVLLDLHRERVQPLDGWI